MPTRAVLLQAGPTPWDVEGRIVGNSSLPLTAEAMDAIRHLLDNIPGTIEGAYRPAGNEACDQVAQIVGRKYNFRPRDNSDLDELGMGLWQGLFPDDVRARFPTIYPQWEEHPLAVTPPDGEPLDQAIRRIRAALCRIIRKSKGQSFVLALRPMAFQIARGILRMESSAQIAQRLRDRAAVETIDIDPAAAKTLAV